MIELAAGGRAETTSAGLEAAGGWRPAAHLGVLLATFGLMTLPALVGLLVLSGAIR